MKKILIMCLLLCSITFLVSMTPIEQKINTSIVTSDFCQGWEAGYCEGWREVKGQYAVCPVTPICPLPYVGKDTYNAGYNRGFSAGKNAASR